MLDFYVIYFFQIALESLPVSSSGHLKLLLCILAQPSFTEQYEFLLHLPTLLIVFLFFRKKIFSVIKNVHQYGNLITLIGVADVVTVFFYFTLKPTLQSVNLTIGFAMTGIILLSGLVLKHNNSYIKSPWMQGLVLGLVQGCAFVPGISRLAITIRACQCMGFAAADAFFISWVIVLPLMAAAVAKGLLTVPIKAIDPLLIMIVCVATGVGYYLMDVSCNLTIRHTLWKLSIYMFLVSFISLFVVHWCT